MRLRQYDEADDSKLAELVRCGEGWVGKDQKYRSFAGGDIMFPVIVERDNGEIVASMGARLVGELVLVTDKNASEYVRSKAIYRMAGSVVGNLERSGISQINVPILGVGNTERAKEFGFVKDPREIWVRW